MNQMAYPGMAAYVVRSDALLPVTVDVVSLTSDKDKATTQVTVLDDRGSPYITKFSTSVSLTPLTRDEWLENLVETTDVLYNEMGIALCLRREDAEDMLAAQEKATRLWQQLRSLTDNAPTLLPADRLEKLERAVAMVGGLKG